MSFPQTESSQNGQGHVLVSAKKNGENREKWRKMVKNLLENLLAKTESPLEVNHVPDPGAADIHQTGGKVYPFKWLEK